MVRRKLVGAARGPPRTARSKGERGIQRAVKSFKTVVLKTTARIARHGGQLKLLAVGSVLGTGKQREVVAYSCDALADVATKKGFFQADGPGAQLVQQSQDASLADLAMAVSQYAPSRPGNTTVPSRSGGVPA